MVGTQNASQVASGPSAQHLPSRPPQDELELPIPPTNLMFALRNGRPRGTTLKESACAQRYVRRGDAFDATTAVIGTGGFGTAYRYERVPEPEQSAWTASPDSSFSALSAFGASSSHTTNTSFSSPGPSPKKAAVAPSVASSPHRDSIPMEREHVEALDQQECEQFDKQMRKKLSHRHLAQTSVPQQQLAAHTSGVTSESNANSPAIMPDSPQQLSPNKPPAVIVVKVCRTPTTGSFDELPRCGVPRAEVKRAEALLNAQRNGELTPDLSKIMHTRIVRGELLLLKFLQGAATAEGFSHRRTHTVRLIADMSMHTACSAVTALDPLSAQASTAATYERVEGGPPLPRLLVFERLVDLDAHLTPRGWVKSRTPWTVAQVEAAARDVARGLRFLHSHCVAHGDLKPSNLMRCAKTGVVKLIDLGASRRWVRLPVDKMSSTSVVEGLDEAIINGQLSRDDYTRDVVCEGLGSFTGSPHFMAPEILLQASRYLSTDGYARSVLDDHVRNPAALPAHIPLELLELCYDDFKRGWGVAADIWSWGCTVQLLMMRTQHSLERPRSSAVCPFSFSFEHHLEDAIAPLYPQDESENDLPRFRLWARCFSLQITQTLISGVELIDCCTYLSPQVLHGLKQAMQGRDARPNATQLCEILRQPVQGLGLDLSGLTEPDHEDNIVLQPSLPATPQTHCSNLSRADSIHNLDGTSSTGMSLPSHMHRSMSSAMQAREMVHFSGAQDDYEADRGGLAVRLEKLSQRQIDAPSLPGQSQLATRSLRQPLTLSTAPTPTDSTNLSPSDAESPMFPDVDMDADLLGLHLMAAEAMDIDVDDVGGVPEQRLLSAPSFTRHAEPQSKSNATSIENDAASAPSLLNFEERGNGEHRGTTPTPTPAPSESQNQQLNQKRSLGTLLRRGSSLHKVRSSFGGLRTGSRALERPKEGAESRSDIHWRFMLDDADAAPVDEEQEAPKAQHPSTTGPVFETKLPSAHSRGRSGTLLARRLSIAKSLIQGNSPSDTAGAHAKEQAIPEFEGEHETGASTSPSRQATPAWRRRLTISSKSARA
ncbi:myosin light chain smooth muscle [Ceraceosorus bombacis]|uniref:non-specific serine/threonine protein kinase n=1 Tax=Ceraceosorus bombacis TaxID=401625 RepID=A0A0P1BJV7_9BASI|nr:myosin light chain smooth muscle [Ceraceosorus bombacis]